MREPKTFSGFRAAAERLLSLTGAPNEGASPFVDESFASWGNGMQEKLNSAAEAALGPLGRLALCGLDGGVQTPEQLIALAVHFSVLGCAPAGTCCVGSGDAECAPLSWPAVLPPNWQDESGTSFSFRYEIPSKKAMILLKAVVMGDVVLVNMLRQGSTGAPGVQLRVAEYCSLDTEGARAVLSSDSAEGPDLRRILGVAAGATLRDLVRTALVEAALRESTDAGAEKKKKKAKAAGSSSSSTARDQRAAAAEQRAAAVARSGDPLRVGPPRFPGAVPVGGIQPPHLGGRGGGIGGLGGFGDDLTPGGGLGTGGSLLLGPPGGRAGLGGGGFGGGLPPGVPPGARFDPYGPPGTGFPGMPGRGGRSGPTPDHLPPPNGYGDMFM